MAIFLLRGNQAPSAVETALLSAIPGLIEASSFDRVFEGTPAAERGEPAIVLVVAPPAEDLYFDRLIEVAAEYRNQIFLILISDEISGSDYKRLVRTGAADWASTKAVPREVLDIIARRRQEVHTPAVTEVATDQSQPPVTISFVPSAGGVGNTTLAVETAIHLKKGKNTKQRRICIVDLDFQTSHICDYLDSEPRLQIDEFSGSPERLDRHLFDMFITHHPSAVDVFAAPRTKFASEDLDVNALDALFNMIAKRYDLVFIDHPLHWFSWTKQVIAASDATIITGTNTIPCLRQITETLALVRSSASAGPKIGIVINRCERTMLGTVARRRQAERVLRDEQCFFFSQYPEAVDSSNVGVPMALGPSASKLQKEFAPLADFCAGVKSIRPQLA